MVLHPSVITKKMETTKKKRVGYCGSPIARGFVVEVFGHEDATNLKGG